MDDHIELTREDFDALALRKLFADGPWKDTFGDGYGEPYNPNRWLFGTLKDGRRVKARYGTQDQGKGA